MGRDYSSNHYILRLLLLFIVVVLSGGCSRQVADKIDETVVKIFPHLKEQESEYEWFTPTGDLADAAQHCLNDYKKLSSLLDHKEGKVTGNSVNDFLEVFEHNAKVYYDIYEEAYMINVRTYADNIYLYLRETGVNASYSAETIKNNKYTKARLYNKEESIYLLSTIIEKKLQNGIDTENKPTHFHRKKGKKVYLKMEFYVYKNKKQAKIINIYSAN